jgi:TM2 domain-containing membrane protein YozV
MSSFVLWLIAMVLAIIGIVQLLQGQIVLGVVLLIVAALVGPGGYSVFRSRNT